MEENKRWERLAALAERLGVTASTIRRWTIAGRIPQPRRIGRIVLWDRDEVDRHIQEGKGGTQC